MRKTFIVTVMAGLLLAVTPLAFAQQDTPECEQAIAAVVVLESDLERDLAIRDRAQAQLESESTPAILAALVAADAQLKVSQDALTAGLVVRSDECSGAVATPTDLLNCDDFDSQLEAQAVLDEDNTDPNRLDADLDGQACEIETGLPATRPDRSNDSLDVRPDTSRGVDTGDGSTL